MGDVIDTFVRPFVGTSQAGFVDPCRHGFPKNKEACAMSEDFDWILKTGVSGAGMIF